MLSPHMAYTGASADCARGDPNKPGSMGGPSPSLGTYPASVRRYTGPLPFLSQSGFTPSFSNNFRYQSAGMDCRLLASATLDWLTSSNLARVRTR